MQSYDTCVYDIHMHLIHDGLCNYIYDISDFDMYSIYFILRKTIVFFSVLIFNRFSLDNNMQC